MLSTSQNNVIEIKELKGLNSNIKDKYKELLDCIRIKFIFFFILNYALIFSFWFYLASFCAVYKNTQLYLIKDVLRSFGLSFISPFFINLFPCIIRIFCFKREKKYKQMFIYAF